MLGSKNCILLILGKPPVELIVNGMEKWKDNT
jgi:hypothetical protein